MPTPHRPPLAQRLRVTLTALSTLGLLALAGCGGGGGDTTTPPTPEPPVSVTPAQSFPLGLAVAAPGELEGGASPSGADRRQAQAAGRVNAHTVSPALLGAAARIESLLGSTAPADLRTVLDFDSLYGRAVSNAPCYGPMMPYASHQDAAGGPDAGTLPSGDLGLWLATDPSTGTPCAQAQIEHRIDSVQAQALHGLGVAALMRGLIVRSSTLAMPGAGSSTNLTSAVAAAVASGWGASLNILSASLALDAGATTYTYRLLLDNGMTGSSARLGEMILRHQPGASASNYQGTLQVSGFLLDGDVVFGCSDAVDSTTGLFKVARISTLRYQRSGDTLHFGARASHYCGHPSGSGGSIDYGAQVAGMTAQHELDPADQLGGTTRGTATGWRGNFTRYAADYSRLSGAGSFLLAWQAGTGDSHSRALAATVGVDVAGLHTLDAYYAYADEIAATTGDLQGLICNWAGPGASHSPGLSFQSQQATRAASATSFSLTRSLITYAPTASCSSTTTVFDVDADGILNSGEGLGLNAVLDGLTGSRTTVADELSFRGYSRPALF